MSPVLAQSGQSSRARICLLLAAGSTGRCNTGVKSLRWGFELQGLTWSFIELTRHFVQIGLRVHRQVSSLRKVPVSYTHLRAHETRHDLVCRLLLEKKKKINRKNAI